MRYPFLVINEAKIRKHFLRFKRPKVAASWITDDVSLAMQKLDEEQDISKLAQDDAFCEALAKSLFPQDVIELFGDYKTLLALPSKTYDGGSKYLQLPNNFMPDEHDILVTMDSYGRPLIAIRLVPVDSSEEISDYFIVVQARESGVSVISTSWRIGQNSELSDKNANSVFYVSVLQSSVSIYHPEPKQTYYDLIEKLVKGEAVQDLYNRSNDWIKVRCPYASKKAELMTNAALKIQSIFRGHQKYNQYKSYKDQKSAIKYDMEHGNIKEAAEKMTELDSRLTKLRS